ncbi:MAG TPA: MBL fold metallo-hydrolase [Terriglobales bacterium]|nr:MBL fold metallo-hydrolase [Terriglobales bacterium]
MKFFLLALLLCCALAVSAQSQDRPLKVTLLGTGVPDPDPDRFGASILVQTPDANLLFDVGRGAVTRLKQAGVSADHIRAVFLTHLHYDHFASLPDLLLTAWLFGRTTPLPVYGPPGSLSMTAALTKAFSADVASRSLPAEGAQFRTSEIHEGLVYEQGALRVTAFLVDHRQLKPAFGYRIDYHNRSVIVSGDTRYSANLVKFAKGADVVMHAAWLPDAKNPAPPEKRGIASAEDAARVFAEIKPRLGVIYHYLAPEGIADAVRRIYPGRVVVADDLTTITVTDKDVLLQHPKSKD